MDCRKLKNVLFTLLSILIFVEIIALIKVLLAGVQGYEWGSVTDWFSAIGSLLGAVGALGTLWVAYKALSKVPEWMVQKHYDIAYGMIENAIFKDLSPIRTLSLHYKIRILVCIKDITRALNKRSVVENDFISNTINVLETNLNEYQSSVYNVINHLKAISRTDYMLSDYCLEILKLLEYSHQEYGSIHYQFQNILFDLEINMKDEISYIKKIVDGLHSLQSKTTDLNDKIAEHINKIYSENKPIKDFIIPNHH
ncbi:hypothetical protein ACQ7NX_06600 [Enterobacter cloacae subsp. dissolvens]